jgi:hypothetical protein
MCFPFYVTRMCTYVVKSVVLSFQTKKNSRKQIEKKNGKNNCSYKV